MIELFEHNRIAYEAAVDMLQRTGKAAVVHPTGTGKSFIAFKLSEDNPDKRILWLSPSEYIFKTQLENLKAAGGDAPRNVNFITYAKLMNANEAEIAAMDPDVIICDEFHRAGADRWQIGVENLLKQYPDVPMLGLSATAIRYLDSQRDMADELFDGNIASEMTLGEAIVRGVLNPPKYVLSVFAFQKDLERYQNRVRRAKNKAVRDAAERYLDALRRALDKADGLDVIFDRHMTDRTGKYIVFCANKEHMDEMMEKTGEWFHKVDPAPHVYSVYSEDPGASQSFVDFKADRDDSHLRLLYCIDALNEGIHVEDVSGVVLLRPTVSPIIYKQQIGRALSASKAKEPVIFDIVMNIENLYSIDSLEGEMRVSMAYFRYFGDGGQIVNERFKVIDELRDCRELFERLNDTLTASWDIMYEQAKKYADAYGSLEIPNSYKTPEGYSLGHWIFTQRGIYRGVLPGTLSRDRIDKLDAIGMLWDSVSDRSWKRFYAAAKEYARLNGNLRVPANYISDGVHLGSWIANLRACRKNCIRGKFLTDDRIAALDALGMVWDVPDYLWERNYNAAMLYCREHGNLNVPVGYVAKDGTPLGAWLNKLRTDKASETLRITEEQAAQLDKLGMVWEKKFNHAWERGFEAARDYFDAHGDLGAPFNYVTPSGVKLGAWLCNQRDAYRAGKIKPKRAQRLERIGMVWQKEDPWELRFALAEAYYREHGNLNVPGNYSVDGIGLGKWVNEQKQSYRGNRPKQPLTEAQIERLESIGIEWRNANEAAWDRRYAAVKAYFDEHGDIEIPKELVLSDGRTVGSWFKKQRTAKRNGKLTVRQIEKLDAVGMVWERPDPWENGFAHAERYYWEHGDLLVPAGYVCNDGFDLYKWISNQRNNHNNPSRYHQLTSAQSARLEGIGMVWYVLERQWLDVYEAAAVFFDKHGHLDVPVGYKTERGVDLWEWLRTQRNNYRKGTLPSEYIQKLEMIGIDWLFPTERNWENYYAEAQRFYLAHGNLAVPVTYRTENGLWLGRWVRRQRKDRAKLKNSGANGNQIARLEQIGMTWDIPAIAV